MQKKNRPLCKRHWISSSGSSKGTESITIILLTVISVAMWTLNKVCCFFPCRKDPSAFFSFPVTDLIAPGYSAVIKRPMDFSTMKDKVKKDLYQSLDELKVCVWFAHKSFSAHRVCTHSCVSHLILIQLVIHMLKMHQFTVQPVKWLTFDVLLLLLLQVDFKIMCENAMIYNKPETIYHKAARKLLRSGMKILNQVRNFVLLIRVLEHLLF